jgi:hypothetical protein
MVEPFDSFPAGGRTRLGIPKPGNASCRTGYGKSLQHLTGQTGCAYCGVDLTTDYYRWLLLTVDHVVPRGYAETAGIPRELIEDAFNLVIACSGCNGFTNRYRWSGETPTEWTDVAFADFRDLVFLERRAAIELRREREVALFATKPWEAGGASVPAPNGASHPVPDVISFTDNDAGYLAWIDDNPNGFVINALRTPKSGPVLLHRARCKWITGTPPNGNLWTGEQIKHCATSLRALETWAYDATGQPPKHCKLCHPAPG